MNDNNAITNSVRFMYDSFAGEAEYVYYRKVEDAETMRKHLQTVADWLGKTEVKWRVNSRIHTDNIDGVAEAKHWLVAK